MRELLKRAELQDEAENICESYSLNPRLLQPLLRLNGQFFNNNKIAQKLGVHRVTVQRYAAAMRSMSQKEIDILYTYFFNKEERENAETS